MLAWTGIFWGSDFNKASNSPFVANSSRLSKMMPKMLAVLALLAHGAVSVRPGTWLSEGQLELEKVEEKEIEKKEIAEEIDEEKLVDEVQQVLQSEEVGIKATRHQIKEFIRTMHNERGLPPQLGIPPLPPKFGWKDWTWLLQDPTKLRSYAKFFLPLDVGASAVAFCGDLVKYTGVYEEEIKNELRGHPEELCSQVLTGSLSKTSNALKWAKDAAQVAVAETDGQQHPYGRLDGVAWKDLLGRVCHDECEELVQGIRDKAGELADSAKSGKGTIEDACADHVVRRVEAEILGCCEKSCGWNGQFCSFFPFLSSKEQTAWQAECCSERNILNGSSRQRLCDSTLSQADKIKSQKIVDKRPNKANDREILGQDDSDASNSVSLMERSFGGSLENMCPQDINLHNIHEELRKKEWKRMPSDQVEMDRWKLKDCKDRQKSRGACKAFLLDETTDNENKKRWEYICCDKCGLKPPANSNPELKDLTDPAPNADGFLYVHKEIYSTKWQLT